MRCGPGNRQPDIYWSPSLEYKMDIDNMEYPLKQVFVELFLLYGTRNPDHSPSRKENGHGNDHFWFWLLVAGSSPTRRHEI